MDGDMTTSRAEWVCLWNTRYNTDGKVCRLEVYYPKYREANPGSYLQWVYNVARFPMDGWWAVEEDIMRLHASPWALMNHWQGTNDKGGDCPEADDFNRGWEGGHG